MEGGDLSNRTAPRLLFVYEHLIAHPPDDKKRKGFLRRPSVAEEVARWRIDGRMTAHLWKVQWESPYGIDILTFLGQEYAEAIEQQLDDHHVPYSNVYYADDPVTFARFIVGQPWVGGVYHALPDLVGLLGSTGSYVSDPVTFDPYG